MTEDRSYIATEDSLTERQVGVLPISKVSRIRITMCLFCRHFRAGVPGATCDAFPDGVPDEIFSGSRDHILPYPGDRGIQFEPEDDAPQWIVELKRRRIAHIADTHLGYRAIPKSGPATGRNQRALDVERTGRKRRVQ